MARHQTLIIKDSHRGLLYEDGHYRELLPAGRYQIPGTPSTFASLFRSPAPRVEVVLVDIRSRDRTVVVPELLTADGVTISASFMIQFRVIDPVAATHRLKNFEERLYAETQIAARRILRGLSVGEILSGRDEVGEEMMIQVGEAVGPTGLEVTGIDFKDLIVPEDLRKVMNQAVVDRRARQSRDPRDTLAISHEPSPTGAGVAEAHPDRIFVRPGFDRAEAQPAEREPAREAAGEGFVTPLLRYHA